MSHSFVFDATFWQFLLELDEDLAATVRSGGCVHCGAVLHSAPYPRKPRGIPRSVLGRGYEQRLSLCCSREGCRRRCTPPSVRFFNRRVYLGALVVLVSALGHGLSGRRRAQLRTQFGATLSERTLRRWQRWWRERCPATRWWRAVQARFMAPPLPSALPRSLIERFGTLDSPDTLVAALRFLTPLSIGAAHTH